METFDSFLARFASIQGVLAVLVRVRGAPLSRHDPGNLLGPLDENAITTMLAAPLDLTVNAIKVDARRCTIVIINEGGACLVLALARSCDLARLSGDVEAFRNQALISS